MSEQKNTLSENDRRFLAYLASYIADEIACQILINREDEDFCPTPSGVLINRGRYLVEGFNEKEETK